MSHKFFFWLLLWILFVVIILYSAAIWMHFICFSNLYINLMYLHIIIVKCLQIFISTLLVYATHLSLVMITSVTVLMLVFSHKPAKCYGGWQYYCWELCTLYRMTVLNRLTIRKRLHMLQIDKNCDIVVCKSQCKHSQRQITIERYNFSRKDMHLLIQIWRSEEWFTDCHK